MGKIRNRAKFVKAICLSATLLGWQVLSTDNVTKTAIPVKNPTVRRVLSIAGVEETQDRSFVFDMDNAPQSASVRRVVLHSTCLHTLIKLAAPLWTIASLETVIEQLLKSNTTLANRGSESEDTDNGTDYNDDEEEQLGSSSNADIYLPSSALPNLSVFARAIDAVCSWPAAAITLTRSGLLGSATIDASVIDLPRKPIEGTTNFLLLEHWQTAGRWRDSVTSVVKPILLTLKDKGDSRGTVHCEAGLLASLLHSSPNEPSVFNDIRNEIGNSVTQVAIAVGKKCCPLCHLLCTIVSKRFGINIELPGQHTQYFPWVPPESLQDDVLREMETEMLHSVSQMLIKNLGVQKSRSSSPASVESDPMFENYLEEQHLAK
ncbi:hypothetical protein B0H10DRAFT_1163192 [Mycena sp. CBHHK59/15]|nr:hypothetical protein B0H10DRAFT_1163192 [Mycena sp. CBHHK59/15]